MLFSQIGYEYHAYEYISLVMLRVNSALRHPPHEVGFVHCIPTLLPIWSTPGIPVWVDDQIGVTFVPGTKVPGRI